MKQVRHHQRAATTSDDTKIGSMKKDPNMHYVLAEREVGSNPHGFNSPIDEMLNNGYSIASEEQSVTQHGKKVLLQIPKEEFERRQQAAEDEARSHVRPGTVTGPDGITDVIERGGPLSTAQLSGGRFAPPEPGPL